MPDEADGTTDAALVERLADPAERRRLRGWPDLPPELAARLLDYRDDFRGIKRDASLAAVIARAPLDALLAHGETLASGPGAAAFWQRLADDAPRLTDVAEALAASADRLVAETTLGLVVLDPLDPWGLGDDRRARVAIAGLASPHAPVRGLAAEFLARVAPSALVASLAALVRQPDARLRAIAWRAGFTHDRRAAEALAFELLGDEEADLAVRRSALLSAGEYLPTTALVDLLAWFVAHPDPDLAGDAANLLYELHRNPLVAEAALRSPHPHVRELAERLLDPLRGSPAAGGNRPGSPTDTGALFEDLLRRQAGRNPPS